MLDRIKYLALPSVPSVSFEGIEIAVGTVDSPSAKVVSSPASGASVVSAQVFPVQPVSLL